VKCGSLCVLLIFLTREGGALVGGFGPLLMPRNVQVPLPPMGPGGRPWDTITIVVGAVPIHAANDLLSPPGARRRRFPGGGSGSPAADGFPLAKLRTGLRTVFAVGVTDHDLNSD
jgi:hypothetical protein